MWAFDNFLKAEELVLIQKEIEPLPWYFSGGSLDDENSIRFWYKEIIDTNACLILKKHLEDGFQTKVKINRAYVNGQAHGQSGDWHQDVLEFYDNTFSLVFFLKEWPPEYGGHLMIKTEDDVLSFLPKRNRAVIFHSNLIHMGLEPSRHCKKQRESIAVKFTLEK